MSLCGGLGLCRLMFRTAPFASASDAQAKPAHSGDSLSTDGRRLPPSASRLPTSVLLQLSSPPPSPHPSPPPRSSQFVLLPGEFCSRREDRLHPCRFE